MENLKITLPQGFTAGHGRADMTPQVPITLGGWTVADSVRDPLYATCTAVSDGQTVVLLIHTDMKDMPRPFFLGATAEIEKRTGIPASHVILNSTHTHNCPHTITMQVPECVRWREEAWLRVADAAQAALADLAPAEITVGKANAERFNFTRRYVMADGSYKSICSDNPCNDYAGHESEADPELRAIRFHREGKKDIVLANWQMHAAHGAGVFKQAISADFIYELRLAAEEKMGVHFAYHNGASGNLVMTDKMGNRHLPNHMALGTALADVVERALANGEKVKSGKIQVASLSVVCEVQKDGEEKRAHAKEWAAAPKEEKEAILKKYNFASQYEAIATNTRATMAATEEVPLTVITFGDVAFTTTPFESFDVNAMQLRGASPYKMTFTCAYTNGALGYMPCREFFPHGEYEVYVSRFERGTPEQCNEEVLKVLNQMKSQN